MLSGTNLGVLSIKAVNNKVGRKPTFDIRTSAAEKKKSFTSPDSNHGLIYSAHHGDLTLVGELRSSGGLLFLRREISLVPSRESINMADYLLFEGPMGYSLFKVALQGDMVGNRLKEVQEGVNDLAKFGKMVELSSFLPFE